MAMEFQAARARAQRGMTLVEVSVSSLVFSLTFFAAVLMYRNARDIQYDGSAYYHARLIADRFLDRAEYRHTNYDAIPPEWPHPEQDRPTLPTFDEYEEDIALIVRSREEIHDGGAWLNGTDIPYKVVEAEVSWGNPRKSVLVAKRITRTQ